MMMFALACSGHVFAQTALPYSYGFETSLATAGWTKSNAHASTGIAAGNAIHDGSYGIQFYDNSGVNQGNQYLISPELNGTNGASVSFWYKNYVSSNPWGFNVGYSTTDNAPSSFTWLQANDIPYSGTTWRESEAFVCPAGTKYVAFRCAVSSFGTSYAYAYLFLDDISIIEPVVQMLPYEFGFETSLAANGWTTQNRIGSTYAVGGSAVHEGATGFQFYGTVATGQYLISPELDLNGADGVAVDFWYSVYLAAFPQTFEVGYSTTTAAPSDFIFGEAITASNAYNGTPGWLQIEQQEFPAGTKYVAVKFTGNYYTFIDDFSFTAIVNPTPPAPTEPESGLHVVFDDGVANGRGLVIDNLNLGEVPAGAWMEPFRFQMYNDDTQALTVSLLDFTPNTSLLSIPEEIVLPFTVAANAADSVDLAIAFHVDENAVAGTYDYEFVAIYEGSRLAKIWPLSFSVYTPEMPDVVEKAYPVNGGAAIQPGFEAALNVITDMSESGSVVLHDNYELPYTDAPYNIPDGIDAVAKVVFDKTVMLEARVENGANGKEALYTEDFNGEAGPMAHNHYTGRPMGRYDNSTNDRAIVEIAPGGTEHVPYPVNFIWSYTQNQMILTAEEIGTDGMITSVAYKRASEGSGSPTTRNFDIYMMHTSQDSYDAVSDWIPVSAANLVFSGEYTFQTVGTDWQTIVLDTPFEYNGTDNLCICIDDNTGSTHARQYWATHTTSTNRGMRCWGNSDFDPTVIPSTVNCNVNAYVADIQLNVEPVPGYIAGVEGPQIDSLCVVPGTYYLVASSTDADFDVYINVKETPCPMGLAQNIYPADDEAGIEPASVTLQWQLSPFCTEYRVVFSTTYWPDNEPNHPHTIITDWSSDLAESMQVTNLLNNTNYFWRVDQRTNGELGCTTIGEVWGFTTHLNKPHNLVANPDEIYEGGTTTLSWNAIQDRTYRMYRIYKDGVLIHATPSTPNPETHLSYTVPASELEYNMTGYTFNVTAVYDEGESDFSDDVIVKVSGYSATNGINGYVYEQDGITPIGGVTVTVTGSDEFGNPQTYNFVTNADGYYEGQVLVGTYTTAIATCPGYQDAEPYQNGPTFSVAHQASHDDMNFIMDEVFCPPFQVWAEYIEVDGTELVKVWWEPCHNDFRGEDATRALNHYRVYRTDCYNDGPFTEENTILLSTVWVPDTAYIDVSWPDAAPGVYKWGVGAVYEGNNPNNPNNLRESDITWIDLPNEAEEFNHETGLVADRGARAPWDLLHTFVASSGGQYGVATDGNFIYTCSWNAAAENQFHKYDMQGNHIESFNIDGFATSTCYVRDMTTDGQYFYGVANNSNIYCFDLANRAYVGSVNTGLSSLRHCSYDPVNDGFWVGGWNDLQLVSRAGAVLNMATTINQGASGSAYFTAADGTAHLLLFCQPASNTANVYDFDIATGILNDQMLFDFTTTPGYVSGTSGGCFVAPYNGKTAFFGLIQTTPNLIGIYELLDAPAPPTPGAATFNELALPRESLTVWSNCLDKDMYIPSFEGDEPVTVNVLLNSADSPEGTSVNFVNLNEYEQQQYGIAAIELDGSGFYEFDSFRRGRYAIEVYHRGFYTIHDTVNIGIEPDDTRELRYVMEEILYPVRDLYVSYTGTAIWGLTEGWEGSGGSNTGGGSNPTTPIVLFEDDFENGLDNWTLIDADGDTEQWEAIYSPFTPAYSGEKVAASFSWYNGMVYDPDNWMISPLVEGATSIHYYMSVNTTFADHYGVFASSTGTNVSDFSLVFDETPSFAKDAGYGKGARNDRPQSEWIERTVELPAGTKYVAFRHYNSPNLSDVLLEDVTIYGMGGRTVAQDRHFQFYKVMCTSIDGEPIFSTNTERTLCVLDTEGFVDGETYICKVAAMFSTGLSPWVETPWVYQSCESFAGTVNGVTATDGFISWLYPAGTRENSNREVVFDQAFYVTDPGAINGADASWLQGTQSLLGPGAQHPSNMVGDDFTLTEPTTITGFEVYSYQTGSTLSSSYTGLFAQIYDGNPAQGGQVVWGDMSDNLISTTAWTGAYRGTNGSTDQTRPIMSITAEGLSVTLPAGTYYLVWNLTGSLSSGPWAVPVSINGVVNTGDAVQCTSNGWADVIDNGTNLPVGMAFRVMGQAPEPEAIPGIIGAAIFLEGELIDIVPSSVNTYPAEGDGNYCVRLIYDGPMDGTYYSMSCEECVQDQVVVSVGEDEAVVAIYPNPTNGNVKIMAKAMRHITVVSQIGQVVYDADVNANELDLNMARFNAGVYVVRIVAETGTTTQRVTVVR